MKAVVWDSQTDRMAIDDHESPVSWWTDGNGSCDCNRALLFSMCAPCGEKRFYVIAVFGDLEGYTKEELLEWANDNYPKMTGVKTST